MTEKLLRLEKEIRSLDGCFMTINTHNCKDFLK